MDDDRLLVTDNDHDVKNTLTPTSTLTLTI